MSDMNTGKENYEKYITSLNEENARLEAEKIALIEEFKKSIPDEWSPDDLKEKLRDLASRAYARISQTIDDDDNKVLAFNAAKYVFQFVTGAAKITDDNDPNKELKDLMTALKPKAVVESASKADTTNTTAPTDSAHKASDDLIDKATGGTNDDTNDNAQSTRD